MAGGGTIKFNALKFVGVNLDGHGGPLSRLLMRPLPPPLSRGRDPWYRPFGHSSRTSILFEVRFRHYECNLTPGHVFPSTRVQRHKNSIRKITDPDGI